MRHTLLRLLALTLLLLPSCRQDQPETTPREDESTTLASISLEAQIDDSPQDVRSLNPAGLIARSLEKQTFPIRVTHSSTPIKNESGSKIGDMRKKRASLDKTKMQSERRSIKCLLLVRKKVGYGETPSGELVGADYGEWIYSDDQDGVASKGDPRWRLVHQDIKLRGVTTRDKLEIRVVTGGNMDGDERRIEMPAALSQVVTASPAELTKGLDLELPIPFASEWKEISYNSSTNQWLLQGYKRLKLKPLGTILITTLRRERVNFDHKDAKELEGTSVRGMRYVTNALALTGTYQFDGQTKPTFIPTKDSEYTTNSLGKKFYSWSADLGEDVPLQADKLANKYVITWAAVLGTPEAKPWDTPNGARSQEELDAMLQGAITHVYAEGVKKSGKELRYPNFNLIPVMGTVYPFADGVCCSVDAELSVPFRQPLGYMTKYTVAEDGEHFDTSHKPSEVSLVNWKKLRPYLRGVVQNGSNLGGNVITDDDGESGVLRVGTEGMAKMLGLFASHHTTSTSTEHSQWDLVEYAHPARTDYVLLYSQDEANAGAEEATLEKVSWTNSGETLLRGYDHSYMLLDDPTNYVSYSLMGMTLGRANNVKISYSTSRGAYLVRREYGAMDAVTGLPKGDHIVLRSISLGKYFVGNIYTPLCGPLRGDQKECWDAPVAKYDQVVRYMPLAGRYRNARLSEVDTEKPADKTRSEIGSLPLYWFNWGDADAASNYRGYATMLYLIQDPTQYPLGANKHRFADPYEEGAVKWVDDLTGEIMFNDASFFNQAPVGGQQGSQRIYPGNFYISFCRDGKLPKTSKPDPNYMWMVLWPWSSVYQGNDPD